MNFQLNPAHSPAQLKPIKTQKYNPALSSKTRVNSLKLSFWISLTQIVFQLSHLRQNPNQCNFLGIETKKKKNKCVSRGVPTAQTIIIEMWYLKPCLLLLLRRQQWWKETPPPSAPRYFFLSTSISVFGCSEFFWEIAHLVYETINTFLDMTVLCHQRFIIKGNDVLEMNFMFWIDFLPKFWTQLDYR